ncbi:uncharacterized protein LOC126833656 [Adelges cooleyi]|uniref:uncharacterized protein LOC126833656 n=1 Tax=Adelges cooleyi TaxID=133065 RepID=UPI002180681F|nr:uncharacterized protein LOC126833656 [Adelges cooleyi]
MMFYSVLLLFFITTFSFSEGQQQQQTPQKKGRSKFSEVITNTSQECLKENRVTIERVVAVYSIYTNDREAKCYVACMLYRFNATNEDGDYNEKALQVLMSRPKTHDIAANMKSNIDKCKIEANDKDRCERAVKFTRCIYSNKQEMGIDHNQQQPGQVPPMPPFGSWMNGHRPRGPGRRPPMGPGGGPIGPVGGPMGFSGYNGYASPRRMPMNPRDMGNPMGNGQAWLN